MNTVIERPREGIPVHVVKGNETDMIRTLHRKHLFPVNYSVKEDDSMDAKEDEEQEESNEE